MDTSFETVWRRVTGGAAADDEQALLRRWIGDEAEAAQIYACLTRKAADSQTKEILGSIRQAKRRRLKELRVLYFLRTGERYATQFPSVNLRTLPDALRNRYGAEMAQAESYRTASGLKADTAALCLRFAEESERQAEALRKLLERLL